MPSRCSPPPHKGTTLTLTLRGPARLTGTASITAFSYLTAEALTATQLAARRGCAGRPRGRAQQGCETHCQQGRRQCSRRMPSAAAPSLPRRACFVGPDLEIWIFLLEGWREASWQLCERQRLRPDRSGHLRLLPSYSSQPLHPTRLLDGELGAFQLAAKRGLSPFVSCAMDALGRPSARARSGALGGRAAAGGGRASGATAQHQQGSQQQRRRQGNSARAAGWRHGPGHRNPVVGSLDLLPSLWPLEAARQQCRPSSVHAQLGVSAHLGGCAGASAANAARRQARSPLIRRTLPPRCTAVSHGLPSNNFRTSREAAIAKPPSAAVSDLRSASPLPQRVHIREGTRSRRPPVRATAQQLRFAAAATAARRAPPTPCASPSSSCAASRQAVQAWARTRAMLPVPSTLFLLASRHPRRWAGARQGPGSGPLLLQLLLQRRRAAVRVVRPLPLLLRPAVQGEARGRELGEGAMPRQRCRQRHLRPLGQAHSVRRPLAPPLAPAWTTLAHCRPEVQGATIAACSAARCTRHNGHARRRQRQRCPGLPPRRLAGCRWLLTAPDAIGMLSLLCPI